MTPPAPDFRALIADPSSHMAGLVSVMLKSLKIRIAEETDDLRRLGDLLSRRAYNLVLIDEQLAGEAGFELIRQLRKSEGHPNRHVPIIMMAAAPDTKMIAAARDAGVNEFLRKPFSAQHIQSRLDTILKAPRAFVETDAYAGPDRRRRREAGLGRRASDAETKKSA